MRRTSALIFTVAISLVFAGSLPAVTIDPTPEQTTFAAPLSRDAQPAQFRLHLVITEQESELHDWLGSSDEDRSKLPRIRKFKTSQTGHVALVLTEYEVSGQDPVGLEAEIRLYGPDGKLIYEHPDLARSVWGQPKKGYLALLPQVDFTFDAADRQGTYTYEAIVRDRRTSEVARVQRQVTLVP